MVPKLGTGELKMKILFISHDASRTGATIVLLNFLKWIKNNTNISFEIIIKMKSGSAMLSEFKSLAPVIIFSDTVVGRLYYFLSFLERFHIQIPWIFRLKRYLSSGMNLNKFDLIYSNTITNSEVLSLLPNDGPPVICHVHELEWGIQYYGISKFNMTKKFSDRFIAVSKAVRENLTRNHGIAPDAVELNYEFIPIKILSKIDEPNARKIVRQEFGMDENSVVICGSGTTGWRKGPDLFIQLAFQVIKQVKERSVFFLWVGGQKSGLERNNLLYDIKKSGISNSIRFISEKENPFTYFAASDIFAMVSREDPFPLVCLEAAALGKPILCFDQAGGMKEFVEKDAGFVVPYLDISTMAIRCVDLIESPELRNKMGRKAFDKVSQRHDLSVAGPQLLKIIKETIDAQ